MDGFARLEKNCINETQCPPGLRNTTSQTAWRMGKLGKGKLGQLGKLLRQTIAPSAPPSAPPTTNPPTLAAITLFVGPNKQQCQKKDGTLGKNTCLVTKTVQAQEFVAHMRSIQGFDFQPGFAYKLSVRPDQTGTTFTLVSIVSRSPVSAPSAPTPQGTSRCQEVLCMVFCDNGYVKDAHGCEICSCLPAPTSCPQVACNTICTSGYAKDAQGCATCNCAA